MKVYELVFADPEQGFIRQWKRNKREIKSFISKWAKEYPLRELMKTDYVEIPTEKSEFVEWLNENASRQP